MRNIKACLALIIPLRPRPTRELIHLVRRWPYISYSDGRKVEFQSLPLLSSALFPFFFFTFLGCRQAADLRDMSCECQTLGEEKYCWWVGKEKSYARTSNSLWGMLRLLSPITLFFQLQSSHQLGKVADLNWELLKHSRSRSQSDVAQQQGRGDLQHITFMVPDYDFVWSN